MRRFVMSLMALSLVSTVIGCWHVAGVCDCGGERDFCGNTSGGGCSTCSSCGSGGGIITNEPASRESIHELPGKSMPSTPAPSTTAPVVFEIER